MNYRIRSRISLFILFFILLGRLSLAHAEEGISVKSVDILKDNEIRSFDMEYKSGRHYLEISRLAGILGIRAQDDKLNADKDNINVAFSEGSRIIDVNGSKYVSNASAYRKNNALYVPVSILSELFGYKLDWNEQENTIKVSGTLKLAGTRRIEDLFPRSIVRGSTTRNTVLFDGINGRQIDTLEAETPLEILADKAYKWYRVKSNDGRAGWVRVENIYIDKVFVKNTDPVSKEEIQHYVKYKGWTSPTDYMLWTDISRQKLYILKNNNGWYVDTIMDCSTGENISPTIQGEFSVSNQRGNWLNTGGGTGAKYYTRFFGSYYFHSIKLSSKGKVLDATLGMPASMGCIRLSIENAKWIQDNIPANTKLYIY